MQSRILALSCLVALVLASIASAQVIKDEQVDNAMTGAITSISLDSKMLTVKGANGEEGVFATDDKTTIMNSAKTIALKDLKVGWRVAVDSDSRGDFDYATYIEVVETP